VSEIEHEHLTKEMLERYFDTTQTGAVSRMLLHLLAVCPECRKTGGMILAAYEAGAIGAQFSSVDVDLFESRTGAKDLWEALEPLPFEEALRHICGGGEYATWGLAERLSKESRAAGPKDASRAVDLALLAVEVAIRLAEWQPCEKEWLFELRAYAYAHLASAYRISGDMREAEKAQRQADEWWRQGAESMGDTLGYEPEILSLKASLRKDQRRFDEALALVDEVVGIYLAGDPETQDFHMAGRAFVLKAKILEEMGNLEGAVALLREASPLIDLEREPRLLLCVQHNLLDYLANLGRPEEARAMLPRVWKLSREIGNELDIVRLTWTEGLILAALDETARATTLLLAARGDLVSRGMGYDAALVSLHLALLYTKEGRAAAVAELAREMIPIFEAQDIHREALAALAVFQQAAFHERATAELVGKVARYLEAARKNPGLKFEA
jgi:tetratricopeptide (TPR) repeat protein